LERFIEVIESGNLAYQGSMEKERFDRFVKMASAPQVSAGFKSTGTSPLLIDRNTSIANPWELFNWVERLVQNDDRMAPLVEAALYC
jgi:hypothetical protein